MEKKCNKNANENKWKQMRNCCKMQPIDFIHSFQLHNRLDFVASRFSIFTYIVAMVI